MTPEDVDPEDELSPEDEQRVRRLLADAGGTTTLPEDVVTRLDEVLLGLQAERAGSPTPADDLAARRRRRWTKVLVAAATVAVVGVGVGNIVNDGTTGGSSDSAADMAVEGQGEAGAEAAPDGGSLVREGPEANRRPLLDAAPTSSLPRVRTGSATVDAQRIHDMSLRSAFSKQPEADGANDADRKAAGCDLPATTRGERLVAVRLEGRRATLVFRAKEDGERRAEVYSCRDADSPVLATTVRAP